MMERLDTDLGLDASARVDTRENVCLTFDQKVEQGIQGIVDSIFELYKRIADDPALGEAVKTVLFDRYPRAHRQAEELIKRGEEYIRTRFPPVPRVPSPTREGAV